MASLDDVLNDIGDYLAWELEEGVVSAEVAPGIVAALGARVAAGSVPPNDRIPAVRAVVPDGVRSQAPAKDSLEKVAAEIAVCKHCVLHEGRTKTVPGQGCHRPEILFVGEAPGRDEDVQGLAFVGRAGHLLTKMIEAMGFTREDVFIANINKCRPPDNRKPTPPEMATCLPFLKRQIALLQPKVIVAMGATAVEGLITLAEGESISKVRGRWFTFEGIALMPTYHPAYLLRNPAMKRPVWEDLKAVLSRLGHPVPAHGSTSDA